MSLKIVTNETEIAESIIKGEYNGDLPKGKKVFIVAKYYCNNTDKKDDEINKILHELLKSMSDFYVWEMNNSYVDKVIRNAKTLKMIDISHIDIYESEIEQIRKVKDLTKEKVLFSYLIHAKIRYLMNENTNGWVVDSSKDVFEAVGLKYTLQRREKIVSELISLGYLTPSKSIKKISNQVNFISLTGKLFYRIEKFKQLGIQYEKIMGISDVIECEKCGDLVRKKGKNMRFCKSCAEKSNVEKTRIRVEKHRKATKCNDF